MNTLHLNTTHEDGNGSSFSIEFITLILALFNSEEKT